jgi:diguanylate cyclase (GGDEF)-like protein/PAS domain S-box-containing protein
LPKVKVNTAIREHLAKAGLRRAILTSRDEHGRTPDGEALDFGEKGVDGAAAPRGFPHGRDHLPLARRMRLVSARTSLAAAVVLAGLAADLLDPPGVADDTLSVVVVLAGLWLPARRAPFLLAAAVSLSVVLGHLLSPAGASLWAARADRALAVAAAWGTAWLVHRHRTLAGDSPEPPARELEAFYARAPLGLCSLDRELRFVRVNRRWAGISGRPAAAHLGRTLREVLPGLADTLEPVLRAVVAAGEPRLGVEIRDTPPGGAGGERSWLADCYPLKDGAGRVVRVDAIVRDVSESRRAEERLRHLALHDPLTGLPNRALLLDRFRHALAHARRERVEVAAMLLDLDGFKDVNDTLGHPAGDRLLRLVAGRIGSAIRASDTLARLGGDEFALVQPAVRRPADVAALADKVLGTFAAPFDLGDQEVHVSASVGVALFPRDGEDPDTLLKNADLALYRAKAEGRARSRLFEPVMDEEAQARRRRERELRLALERDELVLHYQPQLELAGDRFAGAEALVRWRHPERGLVMPGEFIPLAEANGLIHQLGEWVLREACRQARAWRERGWRLAVAVNLSPVQLRDGRLLPALGGALGRAGLEPARLELEITEGVLVETAERMGGLLRDGHGAGDPLRELAARGVRLAIDDFGTGYSSLAYLKHLPVQTIKVDRCFARGLGEDRADEALMRSIVAMGRGLGKRVVVEGIESERQLAFVRELGCDAVQGFHIARPQPAEELERLLAA